MNHRGLWRWQNQTHELSLGPQGEALLLTVDDQAFYVDALDLADPTAPRFRLDGQAARAWVRPRGGGWDVWVGGVLQRFEPCMGPAQRGAAPDAAAGWIVMPMTATLRALHVAVGDAVEPGALLAVVEAMKLEIPLRAPVAAQVTSISAAVGDIVEGGALLMTLAVS